MKPLTPENTQKFLDTIRALHTPDELLNVVGVLDQRPHSGALGVGGGSPAVSSAEVRRVAAAINMDGKKRRDGLSEAMFYCASVLRRHAAAMDERQPQENS